MALVVETGAGLSNANTFLSLADTRTYWTDRGYDFSDAENTDIESALIRASQYLTYSLEWKGYRKNGRNDDDGYQGLAWPRYYVVDREGYDLIDVVPREVQDATAEVAFYELKNPFALQPAFTANNRVSSLKAGDVQITYDSTSLNAQSARPVLLLVRDLVSQFIKGGFSNRMTATRLPA